VPKAGVSTCNKVRLQKFDSLVGAGERGGWDAEGERLRRRLMTSSKWVNSSTGRSAGLASWRILET